MEMYSQNRYKDKLKRFCRWLKIDTKKILKRQKETKKELQKSDLLTRDEIREILKHLSRPIDKALFMILFETKCRQSEIINLKMKDVTFYDSYAEVYIRESKTSQRNIPIVESIPYLARYLEDYPHREDTEAYFIVHKWKGRYKKYSLFSFNRLLTRNTKFLKKKVYTHLLRHTGLTEMARHLTEFQLKQMVGWTMDSKQAS